MISSSDSACMMYCLTAVSDIRPWHTGIEHDLFTGAANKCLGAALHAKPH